MNHPQTSTIPAEGASRPVPDNPAPSAEGGDGRRHDAAVIGHSRNRAAIFYRAFKRFNRAHMTNVAAALAYYAFLAIPATLMIAVGSFSLLAGPRAVATLIGRLRGTIPSQAETLIQGSLTNLTTHHRAGVAIVSVGGAFALWSLIGAMQNLSWALNIAYEREERRGFLRKRLAALAMVVFALLGFGLAFGVLVLGPHLSTWIGDTLGARRLVTLLWYVAEWPLLVGGLLITFAGLLYFGPDLDVRRWRTISFGSVFAVCAWLVTSGAFAVYASRFGSYNKTWGALAAVVVMLTWLWLSGAAFLLGAQINAEAEGARQPSPGV